ncbi:MAG: peptide chain release factor N(5)-glutamine methyltransferase [Planctomycetes bacterium]|nr:peptide chain release factor N(5)-glutamine methyltransferase [Planctomycetota bacterium]
MSAAERVHSVKELVTLAAGWLGDHGCSSARIDAELLLAVLLERDRLGLWLIHDMPVAADVMQRYRELLKRRQRGEPVAYILGRREFYGRNFVVSPACLIPRPETEHVVDAALQRLRRRGVQERRLRCVDLGTGSGCIAITLALEMPSLEVLGVDLSASALQLATRNASALKAKVDFRCADMFEFLQSGERFDLVVSNPPYITDAERSGLDRDVREHEPHLALFSGADPLAFHSRLLAVAERILTPEGVMVLELPALDAAGLKRMQPTEAERPSSTLPDLAGIQRVLLYG